MVVILMVRVAPDIERPVRRVTMGAVMTVSVWILFIATPESVHVSELASS